MNEFKEITVALDNSLNDLEVAALKEFSASVPEEELSVIIGEEALTVLLREADLKSLNEINVTITDKYALRRGDDPISKIIERIESVKSYGIKSGKRVYVGYNEERKVKGRKAKEKKRGMYYYARDNDFSRENVECPKDFVNSIICDDSGEVLKKLPDNCIDIVITSPPYNFGLDYSESQDDHFWENYFDKLFRVFDECVRVVKFGGRIIVNIQPLFSDYIPSHHIISNYFIGKKLIWKAEILWEKNNYNCKYTAWGSWKSPSNPYFKYTWEFLEVFCKGEMKKTGDKDNIDITGDEFKKWVNAKWSIAPERNMSDYDHPAMFPEELVERALKIFSYENDIVLDPFNGAGTTTYMARKLGRNYLGIDISEEYCATARERIESRLF